MKPKVGGGGYGDTKTTGTGTDRRTDTHTHDDDPLGHRARPYLKIQIDLRLRKVLEPEVTP